MAKSHPVDETRIADAVRAAQAPAPIKCEEKKQKSKGAETANAQEGCRRHSQQNQTSDR